MDRAHAETQLPPYDSMILAPAERSPTLLRQTTAADSFFADFDLNRDRMVTQLEIDQAITLKVREATGGDTALSFNQFQQIRYGQGDAQQFRGLDLDGDGRLSGYEFNHMGALLFDRLDRNRNGIITRDEVGSPPRVAASSR